MTSATDPCAEQLHELSGPLLLYYALNRRLPEGLDALRAFMEPDPKISFACPVSGRPYIYDPDGLQLPGQPGRLLLYDAEPSHAGMRWAVTIEEHSGLEPLITRVVAIPESRFIQRAAIGTPAFGGAGRR